LNEKTLTLEQFIGKHIELTTQMTALTNSISNDDFKKLIDLENKSLKTKDYETALKDKELNMPGEINEIQLEVFENTKMLYNNPKYSSLNEDEFLNIITNEIEVQFSNKLFLSKSSSCLSEFNSANESCLKSFGASLATVAVVGLFTSFGVGSLIGGGIALVRFGQCNKGAQVDLSECKSNQ
jgi:hypothetical protein